MDNVNPGTTFADQMPVATIGPIDATSDAPLRDTEDGMVRIFEDGDPVELD